MPISDILLLVLSGCFGGFLAGLLGVGGGLIFVFVLTQYFTQYNIDSTELTRWLIANSIFCTFWAGISSTLRNRKLSDFHPKIILSIGIPGAITAVLVSLSIVSFDWYDRKKFTFVFLTMMALFLYKMFFFKSKQNEEEQPISKTKSGFVGVFAGLISSLSGLGGGVVMIPILTGFMKMKISKAASISLGVIPIFALAMSLFYFFTVSPSQSLPYSYGYIHFPSCVLLSLGVVLFAPLGVNVSKKLSPKLIKIMFSMVLLLVALKMINGILH